jgi:hypothetical protein
MAGEMHEERRERRRQEEKEERIIKSVTEQSKREPKYCCELFKSCSPLYLLTDGG